MENINLLLWFYEHAHYIYLMQTEQARNNTNPFFKGISLSEYMKDMNCPEEDFQCEETYQDANDLYIQCQPKINNVARFAIRQIDEDNYDESLEQHLIIEPLHNYDLQKSRIVKYHQNANRKYNGQKKPQGKLRNPSNSPIKDVFAPKKEMIRSLYGHSFAFSEQRDSDVLLSTLGMNNWRGKHKSLNKKQSQVKDKNKKQYQEIIKYQNVISQRFDNKLHSIRIDGVKDKIHQRNAERMHYKIKQ